MNAPELIKIAQIDNGFVVTGTGPGLFRSVYCRDGAEVLTEIRVRVERSERLGFTVALDEQCMFLRKLRAGFLVEEQNTPAEAEFCHDLDLVMVALQRGFTKLKGGE